MANYYFLINFLPSLSLNRSLGITFEEFERLLEENLTRWDRLKVGAIRRYFDIFNLQAHWKGEQVTSFGNFGVADFSENSQALPHYVLAFIDRYQTNETKISHFSELLKAFFQEEGSKASDFVKKFMIFEQDLHLAFLALRAKKLLENVDQRTYEELNILVEKYDRDPLAMFQAINEYRFNRIEEIAAASDPFSINRILAYMIQLIYALRWQSLDKLKGLKIFDHLLKDLP